MSTKTTSLTFPRLAKRKIAELKKKAQSLGLTPQRYVQQLVERDLELDRRARNNTFAELLRRGREVDEAELYNLVAQARKRHHKQTARVKG